MVDLDHHLCLYLNLCGPWNYGGFGSSPLPGSSPIAWILVDYHPLSGSWWVITFAWILVDH